MNAKVDGAIKTKIVSESHFIPPSIRPSVRPLVGPSVRLSIYSYHIFFILYTVY